MDAEHIRELFCEFRPVEVRRMFGGVGISAEGLTFAIAFEGVVYLRAGPEMIADLKDAGSKPFVYPYAKSPRVRKNPDAAPFWRMPEHLYDDSSEAARWALRALEAARAKKVGKSTKKASATAKGVRPQRPVKKQVKRRAAKRPARR